MYFSTLKNISYFIFVTLFLSACTGSDGADNNYGNENKSVSITTIPADTQRKVATNLNQISISFIGPVNIDTVTRDKISFTPAISYTLDKSLLLSRGLLLLTVTSDLLPDTVYQAQISGVMDRSAVAVADVNWEFTTDLSNNVQPPNDVQAPTSPANLRIFGNPAGNILSIVWNLSTDNVGLGGYRVLRNDAVIAVVSGTIYTDANVTPATTYQYQIEAFDTAQNTATSNILSVSTPATPPPQTDTTSPTVVSVSPANGTTLASPNIAAIIVDFSEAIDPTSINGSNFTLNNGMTGTISTTGNNTRAQFVPSTPLARGTTYTASLNNNITDPAGNPLTPNNQQVYSWSFSTCGDTPASTYTISWDAVVDADLSGYKVYYGLTSSLSKANASSVNIGTGTSWVMNPASLGFKPCDTVYIAITALGSVKSESAFSNLISEVVD